MSDIATLFSRNPLQLTREDVDQIIDELKKSRHAFSLGNTKAGSMKPPTAKQKEINDLASKMNISL